jgi:signal transduction histidine kinase
MSLRSALLLALAYVLALAIIALGVPSALNLRSRVEAEVRSQARAQADVVAATLSDSLGHRSAQARQRRVVVRRAAASLRGRVLLVDRRGVVLADSAGPARVGDVYASRPEIAAALRGRAVQVRRSSSTLGQTLLATAVPILHDGGVLGAVRITQSVTAVDRATWRALIGLGLVALVVLAMGLAAGVVISSVLVRPLRRLEATARRIAAGDLASRAGAEGTTDQRSLAHSFNDMADHLQGVLESQRRFVADASHQLRTPLTGVRLRLEEARATTPDTAPAAEELDAGMREVDRLAGIIEDLLMLSRRDGDGATAEPVDAAAAAAAAVERFGPTAADRDVELRVSGRRPLRVSVPPAALDRVLDALLGNAIAYTAPGTAVEVAVEDGRIAVLDRGPGLAPGEEETVFARFHRGSAGRGSAGTGLGLAISRQLARDWDGEVTLANRRGGGARAVVVLPGERVAALDEALPQEPYREPDVHAPGGLT